ncbi:hypothetical protein ACFWOG_40000 [Kitasatospora sp. NPDC058406]|uniref:hypothetical protein n=1 Tax=Kitasatospora sp. NPDC058406 TaxID=3346483 RepID=UPI0036613BEC
MLRPPGRAAAGAAIVAAVRTAGALTAVSLRFCLVQTPICLGVVRTFGERTGQLVVRKRQLSAIGSTGRETPEKMRGLLHVLRIAPDPSDGRGPPSLRRRCRPRRTRRARRAPRPPWAHPTYRASRTAPRPDWPGCPNSSSAPGRWASRWS